MSVFAAFCLILMRLNKRIYLKKTMNNKIIDSKETTK